MYQKANCAPAATGRAVFGIGKREHVFHLQYTPAWRQRLAARQAFGLGYTRDHRSAQQPAPLIAAMRRWPSAEACHEGAVTWWVTLTSGGTVVLRSTTDLQNYARFRRACFEQLGLSLAPMRTNDWYDAVNEALRPLRKGAR